MGAIARHGPHHAAQKSTSTGLSDFNTSESKLASVTSTVALLTIHPPDLSLSDQPRGVDHLVSIKRNSYRSTVAPFIGCSARTKVAGAAGKPRPGSRAP